MTPPATAEHPFYPTVGPARDPADPQVRLARLLDRMSPKERRSALDALSRRLMKPRRRELILPEAAPPR